MIQRVAHFFSSLFHPLFVVLVASLGVLYFFPSYNQADESRLRLIIIVALGVGTILLPMISVFMMLKMGRISSVRMENQRERNWPLLQTILIYMAAFYVLRARVVPPFVPFFLLGSIVGLLFTLLINLRWKISLHLVAWGGLCGGLLAAFIRLEEGPPWLLACAFLVAGIVGTSRLLLEAHSPAQVYAGFALGFGVEFAAIYFGLR
ncbi:MAG: phosphatase PAP2 family protein [Bacteroidia bacterium]